MLKQPFHKKNLLIAGGILLVVSVGVFVLWPKNKEDPLEAAIKRYQVSEEHKEADLRKMIETMRTDAEFAFYFQALDKDGRKKPVEETLALLLEERSSEELFEIILERYKKIRSVGLIFYHLDYPLPYIEDPSRFPRLQEAFWNFIEEEFKLTILGVYYKANVDRYFTFQWDEPTYLAAQKLRELWKKRQEFLHKNKK